MLNLKISLYSFQLGHRNLLSQRLHYKKLSETFESPPKCQICLLFLQWVTSQSQSKEKSLSLSNILSLGFCIGKLSNFETLSQCCPSIMVLNFFVSFIISYTSCREKMTSEEQLTFCDIPKIYLKNSTKIKEIVLEIRLYWIFVSLGGENFLGNWLCAVSNGL